MKRSWALISGCSTGIGRAVALRLAGDGYGVIAGVRTEADAAGLLKDAPTGKGPLEPVLLDVTSEDSIVEAVKRAGQLAAADGLRVVINNAGIVIPGPVEFVSAAEWRRQFDVNLFGMIELTRATLPLLRLGVAAHGVHVPRLLFVSSIGGRVAQPILAPYTCSKFATSALGDSLRLELRRQGIGVTVIEPGAIATAIWGKSDTSAPDFADGHAARALYGPEIDGLAAAAGKAARRAIPVKVAADDIVKSIAAERAPARVLVGQEAKIAAVLRNLLPLRLFDWILLREFGVAGLPVRAIEG